MVQKEFQNRSLVRTDRFGPSGEKPYSSENPLYLSTRHHLEATGCNGAFMSCLKDCVYGLNAHDRHRKVIITSEGNYGRVRTRGDSVAATSVIDGKFVEVECSLASAADF